VLWCYSPLCAWYVERNESADTRELLGGSLVYTASHMDTKILLVALVALLIGLGGGYVIAGNNTSERDEHMMGSGDMMHNEDMGMSGAMDDMMQGLSGKSGDDFDKAFLSEMIMHHEGAVAMAEAALKNAKHDEIKQMANAIISAQTTEITQMKDWQKAWYGN